MPDNTDGTIIGLLPKAGDPIVAASSEPAHITMLWFGPAADLDAEDIQILAGAAADWAEKADGVITASVASRGTLGADEADVVFVDGEGLRAFRDGMAADERLAEIMGRVEQYETWQPHVTLGYPDSPANSDYDGETVEFDRLALWVGTEQTEYTLGGEEPPMDEETEPVEGEGTEPTDEEMEGEFSTEGEPIPWHGVLAPIGVESGDGRVFDVMLDYRNLPLPLKYMREDGERHDRSIVVGNITKIWEDAGLIKGEGFFASTPEAAEVIQLRAEDMIRGLSVDLDMVEMEFRTRGGAVLAEGDPIPPDDDPVLAAVKSGRIASTTIVAIPAFQEAWFDLGTWEDEQVMQEDAVQDDEEEPIAASGEEAAGGSLDAYAPGTKDGPGWITDPKPTSRIRRYWTRGKGAAKIRWGAPGDFNRCRTQLAKYIKNPAWLAGTCANMHKEALGFWPGEHHGGEVMTASATAPAFSLVEPEEAMVAAAASLPASWFKDPQLNGPTPMTVTEDGQVYGHAATWNECHIGIANKCVTAPHSLTNYAYFHVGAVSTDEGDIPVGHITMGTGHASLSLSAGPAAAHYDNTGAVVADIHMGEDAYGIWFSGAIRPGVTDEQIHSLKAAAISGDWRPIGAGLEMVAALAVNVPGFPIPRTAVAASGEVTTALVAAAVVEQPGEAIATLEEFDFSAIAREAVREVRAQDRRDARMSAVREVITKENRERMASLAAKIGE